VPKKQLDPRSYPRWPLQAGRRDFIVWALTGATAFSLGPLVRAQEEAANFVVVVHPQNPLRATSREFLERAFLKKVTRWEGGEPIRPIDLEPESETRKAFSQRVLQRAVSSVRSYWLQRIFTGRELPPPEVGSDAQVLSYVRRHAGAVGYVSRDADVGDVPTIEID